MTIVVSLFAGFWPFFSSIYRLISVQTSDFSFDGTLKYVLQASRVQILAKIYELFENGPTCEINTRKNGPTSLT